MESISADYRTIGYFFVAHDQLHMVAAAALVSDWNSGGKETVEAMLESVVVE
jgi:hypothetical protein